MTSPVDTSVKFFSSAMVNAPVDAGAAGYRVALLNACLVDGFDTKTLVSLVALAGIMTATFTGTHSAQPDAVVLVAGVTGGPTGFAGANGEQKVVASPTPTTRTWATALPDGTYTGTITIKMAPLGWARPFTGTNKAVYRSTDPASTGMYLRVDDTGTTTCRVVGYELMSDVDTGVAPFPTAAQVSGGGYWLKSSVANTTGNLWFLIGDGRAFYLWTSPASGASAAQVAGWTRGFGDLIALKPGGDGYACMLSVGINGGTSDIGAIVDGTQTTPVAQAFTPRAHSGLGSSLANFLLPYNGTFTTASGIDVGGQSLGAFPSEVDGSLRLSKKYISRAIGGAPRADLPGVFHSPQSLLFDTVKTGDLVPGFNALAGRNLVAVSNASGAYNAGVANSNTGALFFDRTGPWR